MNEQGYDYDVLVIGSGFGGAVTHLRLTEKGAGPSLRAHHAGREAVTRRTANRAGSFAPADLPVEALR